MSSPALAAPAAEEYASYYGKYVSLVPSGDIVAALESQGAEIESVFGAIPEERGGFRYAPGKWSIRELVGHLADGERVFGYRAVTFARGDAVALPGFEQDDWSRAVEAPIAAVPLADLVAELAALRRSHVLMFRRLAEGDWLRSGVASDNPITVRALAHIMVGHAAHHLTVLREKYLA